MAFITVGFSSTTCVDRVRRTQHGLTPEKRLVCAQKTLSTATVGVKINDAPGAQRLYLVYSIAQSTHELRGEERSIHSITSRPQQAFSEIPEHLQTGATARYGERKTLFLAPDRKRYDTYILQGSAPGVAKIIEAINSPRPPLRG